jgi:Tol biopolymer transport system component
VVLERVAGIRTLPSYAASSSTLVAFQVSGGRQSLVWVNRQSSVVDSVLAPTDQPPFFGAASASLSHDGQRIAFAAAGPLWLYDRNRKVATRARAQTMTGQAVLDPAWDPGDSLIVYRTLFSGPLMLRLYHVGTPHWSPDGRRIAFQLSAGDTVPNDEIWIYSLAERKAARLGDAAGNLASPRWSPDGRWLAYTSDETGPPEVYIRALSGSGAAVRVSIAGGEFPVWRADGRELYYRAPDGAIMAVRVRPGPTMTLSPPGVALAAPPFSRMVRSFDVTPDGDRFVAFGREDPLLFTLVLDWTARLAPR